MPGVLALQPFPAEPFDAETASFGIVTQYGSAKSSDSQRLLGANFEGTALDTVNWSKTETLGGAVTLADVGYATLSSGTNAAGAVSISSVANAAYLSGSVNHLVVVLRLGDTGVAGNVRRWGVFDSQDGLFFELSGTTLRVVSRKNGVDTAVASGSFNGTLGMAHAPDTNFHVWEIMYTAAAATFLVDRRALHRLAAAATSFVAKTSLKTSYENTNAGATTNQTFDVSGVSVSRLGHLPGTAANPLQVFVVGAPSGALQLTINGRVTTGASAAVPVRATTYTEPTIAAQRSIASSSASDTAAGTGARSVKVTYYDGSMVGPLTVTLALNGTTPVNTGVADLRFIEKMEVVTVGSGGANVGTITLFGSTGGGGGTVGTIAVGDNRTFWAHHYVDSGKTMSLRSMYCGTRGGGSGGNFFGRKVNPLMANDVEIQVTEDIRTASSGSSIQRIYDGPITFLGPMRFTVFVDPDAASNTDWFASFDLVEYAL